MVSLPTDMLGIQSIRNVLKLESNSTQVIPSTQTTIEQNQPNQNSQIKNLSQPVISPNTSKIPKHEPNLIEKSIKSLIMGFGIGAGGEILIKLLAKQKLKLKNIIGAGISLGFGSIIYDRIIDFLFKKKD